MSPLKNILIIKIKKQVTKIPYHCSNHKSQQINHSISKVKITINKNNGILTFQRSNFQCHLELQFIKRIQKLYHKIISKIMNLW